MVVSDFIRSFPYERDIITISLSPSLASQAPNVRIITEEAVFGALIVVMIRGIRSTRLKVMPSNESRVIRK